MTFRFNNQGVSSFGMESALELGHGGTTKTKREPTSSVEGVAMAAVTAHEFIGSDPDLSASHKARRKRDKLTTNSCFVSCLKERSRA